MRMQTPRFIFDYRLDQNMKKFAAIAFIALIAVVTMAITFRVPKIRSAVTGTV